MKECCCHLYVILWLVLHSNLNKTRSTSFPIHWEHHSTDRKIRTRGNLLYGSFCFPQTIKFSWGKQKQILLTKGPSAFCVDSSRDGRFWSLYTTTEWKPLCLLSCKEGSCILSFATAASHIQWCKMKELSILQKWYKVHPRKVKEKQNVL